MVADICGICWMTIMQGTFYVLLEEQLIIDSSLMF